MLFYFLLYFKLPMITNTNTEILYFQGNLGLRKGQGKVETLLTEEISLQLFDLPTYSVELTNTTANCSRALLEKITDCRLIGYEINPDFITEDLIDLYLATPKSFLFNKNICHLITDLSRIFNKPPKEVFDDNNFVLFLDSFSLGTLRKFKEEVRKYFPEGLPKTVLLITNEGVRNEHKLYSLKLAQELFSSSVDEFVSCKYRARTQFNYRIFRGFKKIK